jgi:hypothetical protein
VVIEVPLGSLLSPVLFILYIASLYKALKENYLLVSIVDFTDDTNLLVFRKSLVANTK